MFSFYQGACGDGHLFCVSIRTSVASHPSSIVYIQSAAARDRNRKEGPHLLALGVQLHIPRIRIGREASQTFFHGPVF